MGESSLKNEKEVRNNGEITELVYLDYRKYSSWLLVILLLLLTSSNMQFQVF